MKGRLKAGIAIGTMAVTYNAMAEAPGQQGNWLKPIADWYSLQIMKALSTGNDGMAKVARQHVKQKETEEKEANRSVRRSVQECIKPGNVIDDDVQECVRGYREKTW